MQAEQSNDVSRQLAIRKVNWYAASVLFVLICLNLFIAIYIQGRSLPNGTTRMIALMVFQGLSYYLSTKVNYKITAFITVFSFYAAFYLYPISPIETRPTQDLFLLLFMIHVSSVIPYMTYHIVKDKMWIFGWLAVMTMTFVYGLSTTLNQLHALGYEELGSIFKIEPMLIFAHLGSLVFLQFVIYNYQKNQQLQKEEIEHANQALKENLELINAQKDSLQEQKEELFLLQEELSATNDQLELKVRQRTEQLEQQNELLIQYGFMNSHLLRAPIATLKGLFYVYKSSQNRQEKEEIQIRIEQVIHDLDNISMSIKEMLDKEESGKMEKIKERVRQIYGSASI
ncbi:MAG: hypothetical protein AAFX87_27605 [Bacteroidota bacterium]